MMSAAHTGHERKKKQIRVERPLGEESKPRKSRSMIEERDTICVLQGAIKGFDS